jgi:hypothetical protein
MLVLAMQFSRDGVRPQASGSAPNSSHGTGAELDGDTGVTRISRRDAKTRRPKEAGARGTHPHNRAVKPDYTARSVVPGR